MIGEALAEGFALARIGDGFLDADPCEAGAAGGEAQPFAVEILHDQLEAGVFLAD